MFLQVKGGCKRVLKTQYLISQYTRCKAYTSACVEIFISIQKGWYTVRIRYINGDHEDRRRGFHKIPAKNHRNPPMTVGMFKNIILLDSICIELNFQIFHKFFLLWTEGEVVSHLLQVHLPRSNTDLYLNHIFYIALSHFLFLSILTWASHPSSQSYHSSTVHQSLLRSVFLSQVWTEAVLAINDSSISSHISFPPFFSLRFVTCQAQ